MKQFILQYKGNILEVCAYEYNTHIKDSYRIRNISDMDNILKLIRYEVTEDNYAINKRDIHNMINEWRAHNLLYSLGIMKDRTKSVDLNINQSWYVTLSYKVLSLFYFHFN